ncbi:uncharacterized protein Z519_04419 [Cladophialophora bantiana CBS 173.52]|uniref:Cytochrome P450 n=1 Tax=Cladophialophora bantiana (strain ATCC 10958 / CBS 173.52 / CDC B-1940 / NIH 8579) TaxID=1442370 RepID=A0A0D2HM85_CLAB1|nr:uncharacterized protein Z519_04419 [Cladophialophora bantiana CBS 173.52]KIW94443.1 hypothetical protein Z519_04419 [Cladophialophora bantiana CBS 173.52]
MAFQFFVLYGLGLCLAAVVLKAVYRLTLHPLARFPGPKIAAVTNLYAVNRDLISKDSLVKHLKVLHDKYGPIVRVRPNELHIFDWDVFKAGSDFDRPREFYNAPQVEGSLLNISNGRVAKPHRDLFVQAFSKAQINGLEPLIHKKVALFLYRLKAEADQDRTIDLDLALNCLTADVTMYYCYQMSLGLLDAPRFRPNLIVELHEFAPIVPFFWYFPNIGNIMNKVIFSVLPHKVVKTCFPAAASMMDMMAQCRALITSLAQAPVDSKEVTSSIFRTALNPNREKGQYIATPNELAADAVLMFLAGTDTTAHALTFGIWEMMKRPELWTRLREEVVGVLPDAQSFAPLKDLESLPFLRAVIKESLRFSMGTSARLPRIVPRSGAVLCGESIAPGTRVSFSHYVYNNDPAIFTDPYSFRPERWLGNNVDELENHMVSFSRGSRNCIGMNLAYAELYTTFAHLVRRFDIINDGTANEMMDWTDAFTPRFNGNLKVKLRALDSGTE